MADAISLELVNCQMQKFTDTDIPAIKCDASVYDKVVIAFTLVVPTA